MKLSKSANSIIHKSIRTRRRIAVLTTAVAAGLPVLATAIPAPADISITYSTAGSSQLFLPQTGTYTLEVWGAAGGGTQFDPGGDGAVIEGTTSNFTSRDSLTFYVGGIGNSDNDSVGGGGGGGSFLYDNTTSTLLAAAGGGGGEAQGVVGGAGQASTTAGTAGSSGNGQTGGAGGTGANGGQGGTSSAAPDILPGGAGGGGFATVGQSTSAGSSSATGGGTYSAFAGGTTIYSGGSVVTGGYGGGGAGYWGGGGGGGYSGGGGGGYYGGGGGGSFFAPSITPTDLSSGASSGGGFIVLSPTTSNLTIVYGATGTIAGAISGGGAVIMAGTGNPVLTATNNSWTGGTTISSGTFTIGDGGADGSLPGNVSNSSKLVFNSSSSLTVGGNISGTGTLTQSGSGTTVLTGTNSYSGLTTISAGTLQMGNGGAGGMITSAITDNAALVTDLSGAQTYANVISGSGTLTTTGPGVLYLTKQQSYGGSTTIENTAIVENIANALPSTTNLTLSGDFVGGGGNLNLNGILNGAQTVASLSGDGSVGIENNASFTVNQSINTVFTGQIEDETAGGNADTGKLIKQGAGTLVLTGTNIYGGGTTISGGSLQIGNGGTTGSVAGNFTDNANLAFNRTDSFTFSGNISGSGSVTTLGSGTMVVTGSLSHTGGTTISAGSLQIGNGGTTGSITGNITDNANLTFDVASGDIFYGGVISGTGSLTQAGGSALILESANTYTGNTTVNAGSLYAFVNNALPVTTNLNLAAGFFVYNAGNLSQTVASLTGSGEIDAPDGLPNDTFTVNQTSNTVYSGSIFDGTAFGGTGSLQLVKQGNGNLTLTGGNVYAGGTTISAGTLQLGAGGSTGSVQGNILDNAQLTFDLNSPYTVSGAITGTGALTQKGTSTLVLTATNSYTGGTTINSAGTLQLGSGGTTGTLSSTGAVIDNGNLTFDRSDSITIGNYIHGNGSITQAGTGTVTLSASNNNNGGTNVTAGKLIIGAVDGIAEAPVSITGGVLQFAQNTGVEEITSLTITGSGALDLFNNHLLLDYAPGNDPIASIAAWINSGFAGGAWTGPGIMSTAAQTNSASYGIGYADAADPNNPAQLAPNQIEIAYTLLGDANLDGKVNGTDFNILAANFNTGNDSWDQGDFTYDNKVNGSDFNFLAANFNQGASQADDLSALKSFAAANGLSADVPEPATAAMTVLAAIGVLHARRRRDYTMRPK